MSYKSVCDVKSEIDPTPSDSVMKQNLMVLGILYVLTPLKSQHSFIKKRKRWKGAFMHFKQVQGFILQQTVYIWELDALSTSLSVWGEAKLLRIELVFNHFPLNFILTMKNMCPSFFLDSLRCLAEWYWCSRQDIKWDEVCSSRL